jgi:hypothetical protein
MGGSYRFLRRHLDSRSQVQWKGAGGFRRRGLLHRGGGRAEALRGKSPYWAVITDGREMKREIIRGRDLQYQSQGQGPHGINN